MGVLAMMASAEAGVVDNEAALETIARTVLAADGPRDYRLARHACVALQRVPAGAFSRLCTRSALRLLLPHSTLVALTVAEDATGSRADLMREVVQNMVAVVQG